MQENNDFSENKIMQGEDKDDDMWWEELHAEEMAKQAAAKQARREAQAQKRRDIYCSEPFAPIESSM